MFLSHINVFVVFIAMCLFIVRYKKKTFSEVLLILFSVQTFISASLWLYFNYYNSDFNKIIDYFGIINENVILIYTCLYIYYLNNDIPISKRYKVILMTLFASLFMFFIHWLIKSNSAFIIYPENTNIAFNLIFQLILDFVFLIVFILFLKKKQQLINPIELFDGAFKNYILIGFVLYIVQDLLILFLLFLTIKKIIFPDFLMGISTVLNLIVSFSILVLAIQTNWLKEYHFIFVPKKEVHSNESFNRIELIKINELKNITWQTLKNNYYSTYSQLFDKIEKINLSKTEKMYAFFDCFDFSHKELSDLLNVSLRTIETNFYRMRKKMTKNN